MFQFRIAAVLSLMLAALSSALAQSAPEVKVGALQFGTVNWELDAIEANGLDEKHGFELAVVPFANNDATKVALQSGEVDVIVSDWLWVSRQRAAGKDYTFVPYSSSVGAVMVPPDSEIADLGDLKGRSIAVAGGPLDKGWLMLQALAKRDYGIDLARDAEPVFGAPPLLSKKAEQGEVDAVLNYWHYAARLEAKGWRRLIGADEAATRLGATGRISAIGYVFSDRWAEDNPEAAKGFVRASRDAKALMASSDEEWSRLRPMLKAEDEATFETLKKRFREGIPARSLAEERDDTARIYEVLAAEGGEKLVGPATTMAEGTFWPGAADGS